MVDNSGQYTYNPNQQTPSYLQQTNNPTMGGAISNMIKAIMQGHNDYKRSHPQLGAQPLQNTANMPPGPPMDITSPVQQGGLTPTTGGASSAAAAATPSSGNWPTSPTGAMMTDPMSQAMTGSAMGPGANVMPQGPTPPTPAPPAGGDVATNALMNGNIPGIPQVMPGYAGNVDPGLGGTNLSGGFGSAGPF